VAASVPVDHLNLASAADLDGLPGVGPVLAQRIVERRQRSGPYQAVEQLRDEKILPASTYERVKDLVSIN
jgi:competence protein ComEA